MKDVGVLGMLHFGGNNFLRNDLPSKANLFILKYNFDE